LNPIYDFYFEKLFNLKILDLSNNSIETIEKNSFIDLKKLIRLDLNIIIIRKIEDHTFLNMESLHWLDLSNNQISFIENNSFANLNQLKVFRVRI